MKTLQIEKVFNAGGENYSDYDNSELSQWELESLDDKGVESAVYSYYTGSYCGSGTIFLVKDCKLYYHDMGHCSCYGPIEDINFDKDIGTIEKFEKEINEYMREEPHMKAALAKAKEVLPQNLL